MVRSSRPIAIQQGLQGTIVFPIQVGFHRWASPRRYYISPVTAIEVIYRIKAIWSSILTALQCWVRSEEVDFSLPFRSLSQYNCVARGHLSLRANYLFPLSWTENDGKRWNSAFSWTLDTCSPSDFFVASFPMQYK